jgi:hypothetical protein
VIESRECRLEHDELQALIEEARERTRRRRRRNGIAVALGVIAAVGLSALAVGLSDHTARRGGAEPTTISARRSTAGRFWYTRAVSSIHQWLPVGGITMDRRGFPHRHGPEVLFVVRLTEETWVGIDGTMRDRVTAALRFASSSGRATWLAYGHPLPNFNDSFGRDAIVAGGGLFPPQLWYPWGEGLGPYGLDLGDSLLSYRQLRSLPASPLAVLGEITRAEEALLRRQYRTRTNVGYENYPGGIGELTDIGGLLAAPVPAATRLALLHAAMRLPGARVNLHARDSLGREGFAVTSTAGIALQRLIFDPASGALLEGPKGVITAHGSVGSAYALPRGVRPLNVAGEQPEPATLAIAPAVGNAHTVFTVTLTPARRLGSRRANALDWIVAGTPGSGCFAAGFQRPLSAIASLRRGGRLFDVYRLAPPATGSHGWCRGRYELNVVPDYSGRPWRPPPMPAGTPTFSAGAGSSVYFRVR